MSVDKGHSLSFSDYLLHHLQFWTVGEEGSFWRVNLDSLIVAITVAVLLSLFLWSVARKATSGVPSKTQVAVELFIEWIGSTSRSFIQHEPKYVAPVLGVAFLWIFSMNVIDLIPVDWIPLLAQTISGDPHLYFRPLPTADANVTFGIDIGIFIIIIFSGLKAKGLGYFKQFATHPLPSLLAMPFNLFLEIVAFFAEFLSLSLRLFGNMFAGEVIYVLIASLFGIGFIFAILGFPVHFLWSLLHIIVVTLQAYLFTMLSTLYISKAWNKDDH